MIFRVALAVTTAFLSAAATAAPVRAQEPPVGARVRILFHQNSPPPADQRYGQVIGRVSRFGPDTLLLDRAPKAASFAIECDRIVRIDVSRGTSRTHSALVNAAIMSVAGPIALASMYGGRMTFGVKSRGDAALRGAYIGAATGALLGAAFPSEIWRRIR